MTIWRLAVVVLLLPAWADGAWGAGREGPPGRALRITVKRAQSVETIARRYYGNPGAARAILAANGLDPWGRRLSRVARGQRLALPTAWGYRIRRGDRWAALALRYLGDARQAAFLARLSGKVPGLRPPLGHVILVPALVSVRVPPRGRLTFVASRLLGLPAQASAVRALVHRIRDYNRIRGRLSPRRRIWVPLVTLRLLAWYLPNPPPGLSLRASRRARAALLQGATALRRGDFHGALAVTGPALGWDRVEAAVVAGLWRVRVTAWVALNRMDLARKAAAASLRLQPSFPLDAALVSPKVRAVFRQARRRAGGKGRQGGGTRSRGGRSRPR